MISFLSHKTKYIKSKNFFLNKFKRTLSLFLFFSTLTTVQVYAKNSVEVATITKVYSVPFKYINQYERVISEGKITSTKIDIHSKKNVFVNKNTVIIFPNDNKYKNMNLLIDSIKKYAEKLDNIDVKRVNEILDLLKTNNKTKEVKR